MLGVVVPVETEGVDLALEFVSDGGEDGIVGVSKVIPGAKKSEAFVSEDIVDCTLDEGVRWRYGRTLCMCRVMHRILCGDEDNVGLIKMCSEGGSCGEVTWLLVAYFDRGVSTGGVRRRRKRPKAM